MGMPEMQNSNGGTFMTWARFIVRHLSWKLMAQLLLCGIAYFAWEARWQLYSAAVSRWAEPEIVEDRLPQVIDELISELKPKAIYVWSFNVTGDTKRPIYVSIDGMRRPELEGRVEPLFPDSQEGRDQVIALIQGNLYCSGHNHMARDRQIFEETGVVWGCAVSIPPEYRAIIGAISVGFTSDRSADHNIIRSSLDRWSKYSTGRDLK
jgi:hypothetical protein